MRATEDTRARHVAPRNAALHRNAALQRQAAECSRLRKREMEHADAPPAKQRRLRVNGTGQDREGVGSGGLYHPYPILTIPSLSHPYPTPIPSCPSTDYLPAPSTSFLSHHLLLTTTSATYYLLPPLTHSPLSLSLLSVLCFLCAPSLSHPYPIPIPSLILSLSHPYPIPIPSLFISLSHSYPIPILSRSYP